MDKKQPEALSLTEIARYCFRSEGMSDPPEQFESPTGDMVDYFDHVDIEKALLARITELESQLAQRFDAADMATASAQGFRDGVTSAASWISVDERLPGKNTEVLIFFAELSIPSTGQYTASALDHEGWCYPKENHLWPGERPDFEDGGAPTVTHWMKLPAAPGPADGESNV